MLDCTITKLEGGGDSIEVTLTVYRPSFCRSDLSESDGSEAHKTFTARRDMFQALHLGLAQLSQKAGD